MSGPVSAELAAIRAQDSAAALGEPRDPTAVPRLAGAAEAVLLLAAGWEGDAASLDQRAATALGSARAGALAERARELRAAAAELREAIGRELLAEVPQPAAQADPMRGTSVNPTPDCGQPHGAGMVLWYCQACREFHAPAGEDGSGG